MAMVGIDRNIPDSPHIISPTIIPKNVISAFNLTFEPTMVGNKKVGINRVNTYHTKKLRPAFGL